MQSFRNVQVGPSVQPLFARESTERGANSIALAVELSALLERLGIQAAICDSEGAGPVSASRAGAEQERP